MLYYLIYCSTACELMTPDALRFLLQQARSRNRELVITGMLVYVEGTSVGDTQARFMQVLEGSRFVVESVFDKIRRDSRHRDVVVLKRAAISKRNFRTWDMGFEQIDLEKYPEMKAFFALNDPSVSDEFLASDAPLEFLRSFYEEWQEGL
ncbi:MAG: BLUF domain-containing protein [Arcticibacter sp.]